MWRMRQSDGQYQLVSDDPTEATLTLEGKFYTDDQEIAFLDRIGDILNHSIICSEGLAPMHERELAHAKLEIDKNTR